MSTVYNLEPPPTAKVLLQTTAGDLLLELFAKQTPLASRNFLQLCLDGYYDGTIFHRLVPGFVLQGGDPTGTGDGGASSLPDGAPFADEFHSRLKFTRRGLLGMANSGRRDDNGSQFFLTLDKAEELNGRNTLFGRVVGDTIYNLMRMAEAELVAGEGSERPLYPTTVTGAEVLVNPFEDMVARKRAPARAVAPQEEPRVKKGKKRAGKALLSFGGDEDGEEIAPLPKKPKFNTALIAADPEAPKPPQREEKKLAKPAKATKQRSPSPVVSPKFNSHPESQLPLPNEAGSSSSSRSSSPSSTPDRQKAGLTALEETNAQIAQLKASMKRDTMPKPEQRAQRRSALEEMIPANSTRGRRRKQGRGNTADEMRAMKALSAFREKLEQIEPERHEPEEPPDNAPNGTEPSPATAATANADEDEAKLCDLHFIANCQSCQSWDQDAAEDSDDGGRHWMAHALSFEKDRLGKDLTWKRKNEEELVVIDPREKARDIKEEKRARRQGKESSKRLWDRDKERGRLPERTAGARG